MAAEPNCCEGRLLDLLVDGGTSRTRERWRETRANTLQAARELLEPLTLQQRLPLFHYKVTQPRMGRRAVGRAAQVPQHGPTAFVPFPRLAMHSVLCVSGHL